MTWTDDLKRVKLRDGRVLIGATYRGVPFLVNNSERAGGRRNVTHEFPLRDAPFVEDLGRRARTYHVEGYVLGDDVLDQRDELLKALEDSSGPGQLVHPYYGTLKALCSGFSVRETTEDGRMAVFSIDFVEAPVQSVEPTSEPDLPAQVAASATAARAATKTELAAKYDASGLSSSSLASAETALKSAASSLRAALGPIITDTQELAQMDRLVQRIVDRSASLVREPADLADAFAAALAALENTSLAAPGDVLRALVEAYAFDSGPTLPETTATGRREAANRAALSDALRRALAIDAAKLAPQVVFASLDEALTARADVVALLDEQIALAGDDAYPALVDLRARLMLAVPGDADLARVVTVSRPVAIPSLLLSYQIYGSTANEADIVARNGVRHPGFVAGDLQVLSNG